MTAAVLYRGLIQGGWIGCPVTPLEFETIKIIVTKFKKDFDIYTCGIQLESVIASVFHGWERAHPLPTLSHPRSKICESATAVVIISWKCTAMRFGGGGGGGSTEGATPPPPQL